MLPFKVVTIRDWVFTQVALAFLKTLETYSRGLLGDSEGKESVCNAGDPASSLGQEDPMEKGMATHPVFLPVEFHGQRNLVGYL